MMIALEELTKKYKDLEAVEKNSAGASAVERIR